MKINTFKSLDSFALLSVLSILLICTQLKAQTTGNQIVQESLRLSLYQLYANGSTVLADGNLTNYDDSYSNGLDDDAPKMNNFGENFGIERYGAKLAIEQRKKISVFDTAFFSMWNMQMRNYRMLIYASNLNHTGLLGFWEDSYLNTSTPLTLNGLNTVDFSINSDPASYVQNRFRITFRNPDLIPLAFGFNQFTGNFNKITKKIDLRWSLNNESALCRMNIERSSDGFHFTSINNLMAASSTGMMNHEFEDAEYLTGDNYYRVKAVGLDQSVHYSDLLNIKVARSKEEFSVYPNPVLGRTIQIKSSGARSGRYSITLMGSDGLRIDLPGLEMMYGVNHYKISLPLYLSAGTYQLMMISPDHQVSIIHVIVI